MKSNKQVTRTDLAQQPAESSVVQQAVIDRLVRRDCSIAIRKLQQWAAKCSVQRSAAWNNYAAGIGAVLAHGVMMRWGWGVSESAGFSFSVRETLHKNSSSCMQRMSNSLCLWEIKWTMLNNHFGIPVCKSVFWIEVICWGSLPKHYTPNIIIVALLPKHVPYFVDCMKIPMLTGQNI